MKLISVSYAFAAFPSVTTATYSSWSGFRGAQVNNTVALEGGVLQYANFSNGAFSDGRVIALSPPGGGRGGTYLSLDLTRPFAAGVDAEKLLTPTKETTDANAPYYVHGAMFHNDRSIWTFAGIPSMNKSSTSKNSVFRNTLSGANQGTDPTSGMTQSDGAFGVSQKIARGAYASSADPGQRRGWFLGGMYNANTSDPWIFLQTKSLTAVDAFYEADMLTSDYDIKISAAQSPSAQINGYLPRGEGALVWLPFGNKGVLVALGGTQTPSDISFIGNAGRLANNTYMRNLLIYDIDGAKWYSQSTLEDVGPSQLASFCTAVVPTQDNCSQEIIVYGGYDGTGSGNPPSDDVWILSIPQFQWTHAIQSRNSNHGRISQYCFAPNPSTFITVGGEVNGGNLLTDTFIDVLNLNNMSWGGRYDPSSVDKFSAPAAMVSQLKWPDSKGPGKVVVGNLGNQALSSIFSTPYPTAITPSYPYAFATSSSTPSGTPTPTPTPAPKPGPNIPLIASLATVIPILIIAAIIALFCLRRRKQRNNRTRGKDSDVNSWVNKVGRDEKSNGYSETTAVDSPYDDFGRSPVLPAVARKNTDIYEAETTAARASAVQSPDHSSHKQADRQYFELDNDPRGPTALSSHPANVNGQQSDIRSELGSDKHASELPQASSRENLSVPASGAVAGTSQPSSISRKPVADRRDSTPLPSPATPNMGHTRGTSDVSSAALTASPNTEMRRSQYIDGLPEQPGHLGEGRSTPTTQGRASAYKENI